MMRDFAWLRWAAVVVLPGALLAGCTKEPAGEPAADPASKPAAGARPGADANAPAPGAATAPASGPASTPAAADETFTEPCPTTAPGGEKLSRFAVGSPFEKDYKPPVVSEGKRMWAKSFLWAEAPKLVVEKWLTDTPETKGKYVLIEFWATWCPPCRKSIHLLNRLHEKFGKDLAVIGISDETEAAVRKLKVPHIEYYSAIDTQARMKNEVGVWGIPHAIIVEPGGFVIWEGFPLLKGYELKEETVEKILAIGRKTGVLKGE